jgi:integrase
LQGGSDKVPRQLKGIVATGYYTGIREGEILGLTWNKIDLENRLFRLEPKDTKNKEARDIPVCDELFEILKGILRSIHNNHVFLYGGRPIGMSAHP